MGQSKSTRTILAILLAQATYSAGQTQISACPTTETSYMAADGSYYQICPNSDYQGPSSQVQGNVGSITDCNEICSKTSGCTRSVYDHIYKYCHVKGSPLTWTTSTQFDTARSIQKVTPRSQISTCPVPETTQTVDGKNYLVCPFSDYQGPSKEVVQNVADIAACTKICTAKSCIKAVYDHIYRSCHMKDDSQTLTWAADQQFDTFRATTSNQPKVSDGTQITSYPVAETTQTTGGKTYVICPGSDYQATSQQTVNSVKSATDCANLCTATTCEKAAYNNVIKICYLKVVGTAFKWVSYQGWDSIRITTTNSSNVQDGTQITSCPVAETTKTVGSKTYIICPGSDFQASGKETINGVNSAAECAVLTSENIYERAPYDNVNKICYPKVVGGTANWVAYKGWDSIRVTAAKDPAKFGSGSTVINMPVIPVSAYIVLSYPESTRFMAFSSWSPDNWGGSNGYTQFALSTMADGRLIVTGGADAARASIYDPSTNDFLSAPDMQRARGYQASAILSNGKVFTIGGSWSGGVGGKDGEVYDPNTNSWTKPPGAIVGPMLTNDRG